MKKNANKSVENEVKVANTEVKQAKKKGRKSKAQKAAEEAAAKAEAEAKAQPKTRKFVEFNCSASITKVATEKAQLFKVSEDMKYWVSKSLINLIPDADKVDTMICQCPAWLFFKSGLSKAFSVTKWSTQNV